MSAVAVQPRHTPDEYLALERAARFKSEFVDGQIIAMSGASREHNLIAGNIYGELRQQLRARPCEVYTSDMRVRVSATGSYTYPDVSVACGEIRFDDAHSDTLLNAVVIVEVLSPTTEVYDRGDKFSYYRRLDSLQEYLLIAQDKVRVEHYLRQGEQWLLTEFSDLDATLSLASIGCELALRDVYEKVQLGAGDKSDGGAGR